MGRPEVQTWTWTLCVLFTWMCVGQVVAGPQYVVVIPAVLESGEVSKVCATLLKPNESLSVTVTLTSEENNMTLIDVDSTVEINICNEFQVPTVEKEVVRNMEVEVKGNTFYSREIRKVMIRAYKPMSFIQTDKPIYLPGQTVNFRVVTLDTKFRPVDQLYELIELEDANGNRVGQWLNETSNGKILQLSYSLNSECVEGFYRITMHANGETKSHRFNVEKYVLPKFEVTVETKDEVSIGHDEFEAKVCAKYTFGQPVPGEAKLKVCRPLQRYYYHTPRNPAENDAELTPLCHEEIKQTDLTGCATFTLEMSTFTRIDQKILQDMLVFTVSVEEEGTGIALFQKKTARISYVIGTLSFVDTPKIYEEGANVEGKVKAVHYNNTPIANMSLHMFVGAKWSARLIQNLTTNHDGIATFKVCTEDMEENIRLEVSTSPTLKHARYRTPYYEKGIHTLSLAKEASTEIKTSSSLEVKQKDKPLRCDHEEEIFIKYTVVGENQGPVDIMYYILSKGVILMQGRKQIDVQDGTATEGQVSLKFDVTANMAPFVQLIAYAILPSELVVAHSADFSTEKCFSHKVLLEFTPSSAVPGEETTMQVKADPSSLCGVSAIDKSVLIKEPGEILDAEKIFNLLPMTKVDHIPYEVEDSQPCLHVRAKRYMPSDRDDPHTVFQSVGLKIATNLFVRVPTCLTFRGRTYHHGRGMIHPVAMEYDTAVSVQRMAASPGGFGGASPGDSPIIETVRTFFPETWIWDLVEVGDSGTKDVKVTVPDTITSWETEAFCLSEQGFGLAPRKEITVFQPFFLELTLPYSIIRGEHFELKATVFNYLSSCIKVSVIPTPSKDFTLIPLSGDGYVSCLCANERKTVSWSMAPSVLGVVDVSVSAQAMPSEISCNNEIVTVPERGRIDLVKKNIIVKAEGIEKTENFNWLFCPKDDSSEEEMEYKLPDNVIEGSARASVSVLGDIMGRALKNLDGLLRMPYGCGEQNIALLAPNIYILQYLKHTDQLTPAILEKSTKFLTSGYQRQLNYKLGSGAYSTFGTGSGNTWLTAFVLRSFVKAQSFIYIEPNLIKESKTWLETNQKKTGCFEKVGKLFNNRMKGGVSDEVTLSAYITAAFLEMNSSASDPVVNKSLTCLRESMSDLSNTYTTALMAYVFTLAGDMETRTRLLKHLDMVAVNKGGFLHWNQMSTETSASLSVEITSYVMLAVLSGSPTTEDLGYATRIVRWLTTQQNYYGGFSSTQDTVVALQALALYSTLVFSPEGSSTLTVDSPGHQMTFDVNQNNKLLYQEKELKDVEGKYHLEAKGSACASVQLSVHYNIPTPAEVTTLSVEVNTEANCTSITHRPRLILKLKSLYSGKENSSNMVILNIKMLSGFVPDQKSLAALKGSRSANRVDVEDDHILIYIQQLQSGLKLEQNLELIQELPVQNLKPAVVEIYDYYDPSVKAETEYIYKCVAG